MRRVAAGWVLGLLVLSMAPAGFAEIRSQDIAKAFRLHKKGDRALRTGKVGSAVRFFEQALEAVPSFPAAHIGLGQIAMGEQDFEQALTHFEAARDGYEKLGEALLDVRTRRYADAQQQISTIQDQIRHLESQGAAGGMLRIDITKLQNSISQLEAIEPPNPEEATDPPGEIHFYIGNALYRLNRRSEALEAWETCRERSPRFAMVYNNLALIYMEQGRLDEARESLKKAEELGFQVNPQFKKDLEHAP